MTNSDGQPIEFERRVFEIGRQAIELPHGERDDFLERACDGDDRLRERIDAILALDRPEGSTAPAPAALQFRGWTPSVGSEIGDLVLVRRLATGGMGEVWEAEQRSLQRQVAVKFLHPEFVRWPQDLERIRREARLAARLTHPNLLTVHDVAVHRGVPYLVTELVRGETTLADVIAGWRVEEQHTWRRRCRLATDWMAAVAGAVHACHREGVFHRDIKPTNIMLRDRAVPVVLDFGVSMLASEQVARDIGGGTPRNTPPEEVAGQAVDPVRGDVYQIGLVLYELLTGTHPFADTPASGLTRRITAGAISPARVLARHIPEDVEAVCMKALDRDHASRYPDARALAEDLARTRYRTELPTALVERGGSIGLRATYALRRHRRAVMIGSATLAVAAGLAMLALLGAGRSLNADIVPSRVGIGDSEPSAITSGLVPGDHVVLDVQLSSPAYAYGLRLYGDQPRPEHVAIAALESVFTPGGDPPGSSKPRPVLRAIRLEPGHTILHALEVDAGLTGKHAGVAMWLSDRPSPGLERWLALISNADEPGLGIDHALALQDLVLSELDRGPDDGLDQEERARLAAIFSKEFDLFSLGETMFDGTVKWVRMWRVGS